jgi:putative MATE family efflux protein
MILIMLFHFAIGLTDAYVGGLLGVKVLAAVGYVGQLYWTLMILANALTVGTVSMVSQAHGAKSDIGVTGVTTHSLFMGLMVAAIITALARTYPARMVELAGMPADIQEIAVVFISIFSLVILPTYLMIITGGVLRASGRIRIALLNAFIAAILNIGGDFVFAFGYGPFPEMGFRGIAWSTMFSTLVGAGLNLIHMFRGPFGLDLPSIGKPMPRCLKNLIKLGVPTAVQQTSWNLGSLIVYFLVGSLQKGEIVALAAMTGGVRIEAVVFLPIFALSMAASVLTGNRLGAGDVEGAKSGAKVTAGLCLAVITVPALFIFSTAPWISSFLTKDLAVIEEMTRYLRIQMVAMPFMAIGVSLSGAMQGAGDTFGTMKLILVGMWMVRIPSILIIIFVLELPPVAIWWAMTFSVIIMCALLAARFRSEVWTEASKEKDSNSMLWEACAKG